MAFAQRDLPLCAVKQADPPQAGWYVEPMVFVHRESESPVVYRYPQPGEAIWKYAFPGGARFDLFRWGVKVGEFVLKRFQSSLEDSCQGARAWGQPAWGTTIESPDELIAVRTGEYPEAQPNWSALDSVAASGEAIPQTRQLLQKQGVPAGVTLKCEVSQLQTFQINHTPFFAVTLAYRPPAGDSTSAEQISRGVGALVITKLLRRSKKESLYQPVLTRVAQWDENEPPVTWDLVGLFDADQDGMPELATRRKENGTYTYEISVMESGRYRSVYESDRRGCAQK